MAKKARYITDLEEDDFQDYEDLDSTISFNPKVMKKMKRYGDY